MTKQIITSTINLLKEGPALFTGGTGVIRGKFGAKTVAKSPACIVMPDFGLPFNMKDDGIEDAGYNKKPELLATLYICGIAKTSQEEAEDYVTDLFESVHERMLTNIEIIRGDHTENKLWELNDIQWIERVQTGCVLAVEYKTKLWF